MMRRERIEIWKIVVVLYLGLAVLSIVFQVSVSGSSIEDKRREYLFSCGSSDGKMHIFWKEIDKKETTIHTIYEGGKFVEKRMNLTPLAVKESRNYIHVIGIIENGSKGIAYTYLNLNGEYISFLNFTILEKRVGEIVLDTDEEDNLYLAWAEKDAEMQTTEIMCGMIYDISLGQPKFSGKIRVTNDGANSLCPSLVVKSHMGYVSWFDETSGRFQLWYSVIDFDKKSITEGRALTHIKTTRYPDFSKSAYLAQRPYMFDTICGLDIFWLDYRNNNLPPDKWGFDIYHRKFDYAGNQISEEHRLTTHIRMISDFTVKNVHFSYSSIYLLIWKEGNRLYQLLASTYNNSLMVLDNNTTWTNWNTNLNIEPLEIYRFYSKYGQFSIWEDQANSTLGIFYTDIRDVNPWDYFPEEFCLFFKPLFTFMNDNITMLNRNEKLLSKAGGLEFFKWTLIIAGVSLPSGLLCALISKWKRNNILQICSGLISSIPLFSIGTIIIYYGYLDAQLLELIAGSILSPTGFILSGLFVPSYFRKSAFAATSIALFNMILDLLFWYSLYPLSIFHH
ncbi:MAG: hypothetical protein QXT63_05135 [Thermoplasmata archaeon]